MRFAIWLTLCAACSGSGPADPPKPPPAAAPRDAGLPEPDPDDEAREAASEPALLTPRPARPATNRAARPIDIILRSSPSGATVAVDGVPVGTTPTYWAGDANGRDHEFLFLRHGYAYARYRFVPVTSGVVHARLEPVADDGHNPQLPPELLRRPDPPHAAPPDASVDLDPTTGPGPQP